MTCLPVELEDDALHRGCVALDLELPPIQVDVIVELEPPLLAGGLFSEGEDIPEVEVLSLLVALHRSEPGLLINLRGLLALLDLLPRLASEADYLYLVLLQYLVKFLHFGGNINFIF